MQVIRILFLHLNVFIEVSLAGLLALAPHSQSKLSSSLIQHNYYTIISAESQILVNQRVQKVLL